MRRLRARNVALAAAVALLGQVLALGSGSGMAAAAGPGQASARTAPAGAKPVDRPLPATALPNHGYPKGVRAPVVPPGVPVAGKPRPMSAQERASAPAKSGPQLAKAATTAATSGATNLILESGFSFNDTSLVVYFDSAGTSPSDLSNWKSWKATVYDPATGLAQDSRQLLPSDAALCQTPATFCRSFDAADGWAVTGGHSYYATITVTLADGVTTVVSPASGQAAARTVSDPPPLPSAQIAGCSCDNVLSPIAGGQMVRGSGVNTATGSFSTSAEDLRMPGFGVTFDVSRTYASDDTTAGMMGIGWSFSYDAKVIPPAAGSTAVTVRAEDGAQAVYTAGSGGAYVTPAGVRSTLSAISGGGWKLVTPSQTAYTFDATGRLASVTDERGNGLHLTYTSTTITIKDAAGRTVTGTLNASGLLTGLKLPDGRGTAYTYTGNLLTAVKDAAGDTWTFGYTNGLLTSIVDPTSVTQLKNTFTGDRVTKQVDATGAATTFAWDAAKQESTTTDADGVVFYDGYRGNTVAYTQDGNNDTSNQRYDAAVNPNLTVDPQYNQTSRTFDAQSNPTSTTAPYPFTFSVSETFDTHNNLLTHTDGQGNVTKYGYTAYDELNSVTTPSGNNNKLTYNAQGLVTASTDGRGKTTTMSYDASGNLLSKTSPLGEKSTYTYDTIGRLLTAVDPRGNVSGARALDYTTTYGYDALDRLVSLLAPKKAKPSTTTYNSRGELTGTADPLGHAYTYAYGTVLGRIGSVTDPDLGVTSYTYTAAGRKASVTDAVGDKTTWTYNNRGDIATVVSPRGNAAGANAADFTTTYVYDSNGNLLRKTHPYPGSTTPVEVDTRFDQLNRATAGIDPLGNTTKTAYDNNSSVISVTDPSGGQAGYSYDGDGRPVAVKAPAGGSSVNVYDAAGNVIKSTSPAGGVTTYTYNDDEKEATVVDPRGNVAGADPAAYTTKFAYDPAQNLTTVTDPLGGVSAVTLDPNNRVTAATDPNGHSVTYKYLDDDTVQAVIGPDGSTKTDTTYSYDNNGNVLSRTDAAGNVRYTYDKLNRVVDYKNPLNFDTLFTYDAEGNLTSKQLPAYNTPAAATTINYTFDNLNRRVSETQGTSTLAYSWGYDAKNEVTALTDPTGTRTQGFDSLGRLTSVSRGGQSFGYTYDADGNTTSRTWPDGTTVSSSYNAADQLTGMTVQGGQAGGGTAAYGFSYDPAGRLSSTTYPTANHLTTDRTYDAAGRLSDLNSHSDAGTVARYQLTRDAKGNPTGITTSRGTTSQHVAYTYDLFDRLTAACVGTDCGSTATGKTAYTYDAIGNRLSQVLSGSAGTSTTTYTYDSASQLNSSTTTTPAGSTQTSYLYDRPGNLVQAGNDTFTYNLDNTMASATVGGKTTTYDYDAQKLQLSADTGTGQSRSWQTDVNNAVPTPTVETDTANGATTGQDFLQGPGDTPLGLLSGGQTDSLAPDPLSGVASILTSSGTTAGEQDYDPFGNPRTDGTARVTPTVTDPFGFAGDYRDPTRGDRYDTPNRTYDPATGRFDGVDPVAPNRRAPSASPYAYTADQPTTRRDPTGLLSCGWCSDVVDTVDSAGSDLLGGLETGGSDLLGGLEDVGGELAPLGEDVLGGIDAEVVLPTIAFFNGLGWNSPTASSGIYSQPGATPDYSKGLLVQQNSKQEFEPQDTTIPDESERSNCHGGGASSVFYMPLDYQGRAQGVVACLNYVGFNYTNPDGSMAKDVPQTDIVGSGTLWPPTTPGFWESNPKGWTLGSDPRMQRGHLLARQLGGAGDDRRNLVPLYAAVNAPIMSGYETEVANAIQAGQTVYYTVTPQYEGDDPIPVSITMNAVTADGFPVLNNVVIPNNPPSP
ncbi:MAG: hypothetical protein HOW97_01000 [Catenulispora sp.]|nr:hypothetical protein [Catenulispora sp.]